MITILVELMNLSEMNKNDSYFMQTYVDLFDMFNFFDMHKIKSSIRNEINNKGIYILLIKK